MPKEQERGLTIKEITGQDITFNEYVSGVTGGRTGDPTIGSLTSFLTGAGQGAALEFGDEALAALAALRDISFGDAESLADAYRANIGGIRDFIKRAREENPVAYFGGNIGGAGALMAIPGLQGLGFGRLAATGAGLGAASGFGAGEGLGESVKGGLVGGGLGAGLAPAGALAGRALKYLGTAGRTAIRGGGKEGAEAIALELSSGQTGKQAAKNFFAVGKGKVFADTIDDATAEGLLAREAFGVRVSSQEAGIGKISKKLREVKDLYFGNAQMDLSRLATDTHDRILSLGGQVKSLINRTIEKLKNQPVEIKGVSNKFDRFSKVISGLKTGTEDDRAIYKVIQDTLIEEGVDNLDELMTSGGVVKLGLRQWQSLKQGLSKAIPESARKLNVASTTQKNLMDLQNVLRDGIKTKIGTTLGNQFGKQYDVLNKRLHSMIVFEDGVRTGATLQRLAAAPAEPTIVRSGATAIAPGLLAGGEGVRAPGLLRSAGGLLAAGIQGPPGLAGLGLSKIAPALPASTEARETFASALKSIFSSASIGDRSGTAKLTGGQDLSIANHMIKNNSALTTKEKARALSRLNLKHEIELKHIPASVRASALKNLRAGTVNQLRMSE